MIVISKRYIYIYMILLLKQDGTCLTYFRAGRPYPRLLQLSYGIRYKFATLVYPIGILCAQSVTSRRFVGVLLSRLGEHEHRPMHTFLYLSSGSPFVIESSRFSSCCPFSLESARGNARGGSTATHGAATATVHPEIHPVTFER